MTLISKKNSDFKIKVESRKNAIITNKHGFVVITKGCHYGSTSVRPDILEKDYHIPEGVKIK